MKKSVNKNYIYNLIYQVFMLIVPLAVTPYISRVLTANGVGQYSFSFSLITYFTLFGSLGFGYYAQRLIAKDQGNIYLQSKSFWEINICRLLPVFLAIIVNVILCLLNAYKEYNNLMWIFNINILALAFDIAFLFQGNEEFGKLVIRNVVIKTLSIISIFLLVKNENDVWIYAVINSMSLFLSAISMWMICFKFLVKVSIKELHPFKHLKGTFILFLPTIATSIYTMLDKTLIGLLINETYSRDIIKIVDGEEVIVTEILKYSDLENGFYEQSEKLIKMAMTAITGIGTVMIPRNSSELSKGNIEKVRNNIFVSSQLVLMIGIPLVLGFEVIVPYFVPWFFGPGYDKCIILMRILAPLILIIGFSNVYAIQYLIPAGHDVKFTIGVFIGAIVNLVLNIFFIQLWWSIGAAIATVIAEIVITSIMIYFVRKEVNFFKVVISGWKYILSGIIMFATCYLIGRFFSANVINCFIIIAIGILIYFVGLLILKEKYIYFVIKKIRKK